MFRFVSVKSALEIKCIIIIRNEKTPVYNLLFSLVSVVRRELHSDCLALLQAPHIQEEAQLTLPLDINNYPFYRYVQIYFRVSRASVGWEHYIQLQGCRWALDNSNVWYLFSKSHAQKWSWCKGLGIYCKITEYLPDTATSKNKRHQTLDILFSSFCYQLITGIDLCLGSH